MIGTVLGGNRIVSELGRGGMGTVYLAEDPDGQQRAVKIVHPHLFSTPGFFKRFLREADIGKSIEHDNVVRTLDVDAIEHEERTVHYLVMEYVEGQTLRELLGELGKVPEKLCLHVAHEVTRALAAIHAVDVIHRDLKPENILITPDHVVKVMDLGVARLADEALRLSRSGDFIGSILYAPPEQWFGADDIDGRADLYALGIVLYELATGRHPFWRGTGTPQPAPEEIRSVAELNPQLSPFYEEVTRTLLAHDREKRFASAAGLRTILDEGEDSAWWRKRAREIRSETKRPLRRIRVPRETALYGREAEIGLLRSVYERAAAGQGQVVVLEGEAGIGKTRLLDDFVTGLQQDGQQINFLFGSYPPGGAATAAGAFSTAYREQFGVEELEQSLEQYLPDTPLLIPAFAALLRGDPAPTGSEPLAKDSLQTVFVQATRALASERPTIVLLDDLHFAPDEGRALFAALSLAVTDHRVLLVGTARPGLPEDWLAEVERPDHASHLVLARLGPKDMGQMLVDAFGSERLAQELGWQIAQKSDGNPFFVFEIIRELRESNQLTQKDDGSWSTTGIIQRIKIPSSLMDLIQGRLARLDDEDKDLLELAACCGYEFDPALVAEAAGAPLVPVLRRFGRVEKRHRLLRAAGRFYVFDHHQVQEALYEGLFEQLREQYHAALGSALETRSRSADQDPAELDGTTATHLCQHFLMGGLGERAVRYLDGAVAHLKKGYLATEAAELASRALAVPGLVEGRERVMLLFTVSECYHILGRHEERKPVLAEARDIANGFEDLVLRSRTERAWAGLLQNRGQFAEAEKIAERALALAREGGDQNHEAQAHGLLGTIQWKLGNYRRAQEHHERDVSLQREIGHKQGEAIAVHNLGLIFAETGRGDEAVGHYERSRELLREVGDRRREATVVGNLGIQVQGDGRYAKALEHYESYLALSQEVGFRAAQAIGMLNLGSLLSDLGRQKEARELIERSVVMSREIGDQRVEAYGLHHLGVLATRAQEPAEAARLLEECLTVRRRIFYRNGIAQTQVELGRLAAQRGDRDDAVRRFDEAQVIVGELGVPVGRLLVGAFRALHLHEDPAAALETLEKESGSVGLHDLMEARFALWQVVRQPELLAAAHRTLMRFHDHAPEDSRASMLDNVPLHRDIAAAFEEHGSP